jgi:4-alpha-glucanotransferase
MKLTFNVDYRTNWGESVYISGNIPELGNGNEAEAIRLNLQGIENWSITIDTSRDIKTLEYHYIVRNENGTSRQEWGKAHSLNIEKAIKDYIISDRWHEQPSDKPFCSSAFTDCIYHRSARDSKLTFEPGTVNIKVEAPIIKSDEVLAIVGETSELGNWNPAKAIKLNDANFPVWEINLKLHDLHPCEYKFIIVKKDTGELIAWEGGSNRILNVSDWNTNGVYAISGLRFNNVRAPWKGAGTAIPVFAIRSKEDFGVGDFYDLKPMIDWAAMTGQSMIQILPINDTTMTHKWQDSYPYNANSTFALHPMYIRLQELGTLKDSKRQAYYDNLGKELNELKVIDYERVNQAKIEFFKEIFAQEGPKVIKSADFKRFVKANEDWLLPYAAFCFLRDKFGTPDFNTWGEYAKYDTDKIAKLVADNSYEFNFVYYLQYNLDKQMHHVRDYAHAKGIAIKGDIPIGISCTSVDAWTKPELFNMHSSAGAPPDDFSVLGQNWGFPTYNWEEMSKDGFAWWKARFKKMSEYFDAYRIDHVLGFFRIWQIPNDAVHGLLGAFNPALPYSTDELKYNYDWWLDVQSHTRPYIVDYVLGNIFGEYTDEVRDRFLDSIAYGSYKLKDEFDTQIKITKYFASQPKNDKNDCLCNGLNALLDEVLFIEDPVEKGKYHPRISAQFTYRYKALSDYEKWCYDRLYNDFFYRRHNDFWYGKAMWKLPPLIDATNMLVCAEDLGMIPDCVPAVMNQLEILSLEIQRMPKDPATPFGNTWAYPYYSVCTTSTHDMGGIRQWWEENRDKTQQFYNDVLHSDGSAPIFAEPWICDKIIDLHLKSPSMLCVLPLQDWLSLDGNIRRENPYEEQINVPANPRHYWRYRMHITVEQLKEQMSFNEYLLNKIKASGR